MDDRKILNDFPLPLARGYRRYRNASEVRERHDAAYYLFEIYLKYVASVAIARYLAGEARDHRVNAVLKGLAKPSLGEWLRFLRECLRFLSEEKEPDPAIQAMADLFEKKEGGWSEVVRLHNGLRSFNTAEHSARDKVSLGMLLEELVSYRNRVLGHGAPLGKEHYERFGGLFGQAFPDLLEGSPFLKVRRLVAFDSIQIEEGSRIECSAIEYMSDRPIRKEKPHVIPYGGKAPEKKVLYLLGEGGDLLSLDPLLITREEDVFILNEAGGSPEYLSYSTGERHRPSDLGGAQGDLFKRILGYEVDENRLSRISSDLRPVAEIPGEAPLKEGERKLGDYRILREIGRGGMGTVFEAVQESLGRRVALKVLPGSFALDPKRLERFRREARATARIHHPGIVPVYEVGEAEGTHYYAMEYIDGPSLDGVLAQAREEAKVKKDRKGSSTSDPAHIAHVVEQAATLAEGLEEAHKQGLIHRDVKPSNILIDSSGRYVLVDFGLVRDVEAKTITRSGEMVGTLTYMSPEQVSRRRVDARSDVYSLGATLYEILTGRSPFEGESEHEIQHEILFKEPIPPRKYNPKISRDLETVILHAMERNPDRRYPSASELAKDLRRILKYESIRAKPQSTWTRISRKALRNKLRLGLAASVLVALAAVGAMAWNYHVGRNQRMAREQLIPKIERLVQTEDFLGAYGLAREAERYIADDPVLKGLWLRLTLPCSITSNPPGAEVSYKKYEDLTGPWILLGTTPLEETRIPRGVLRWRLVKPGFETLDRGPRRNEEFIQAGSIRVDTEIHFDLSEEKRHPLGMVWIPPDELEVELAFVHGVKPVAAPGYWIDRFEVTNGQFHDFVDAGGYRKPEFWKEEFVWEGQILSREKAMEKFRDRTGKPGPATWEGGSYPSGKENHPVAGISWYEATAYAEFRGKSLPSIFHWVHAACTTESSIITRLSNFSAEGTAPVGSYAGIGFTGLSDMAGNVKEWCWNVADGPGKSRYILGGSWGEPTYQFGNADARSPWDRAPTDGLRCALFPDGKASLPAELSRPIEQGFRRDYRKLRPVSDEEFRSFRESFYTYDRTDLKAVVDAVDDSPEAWRREYVSYQAGYGGERLPAHIFLPKGFRPPYQTVIYFPGAGAMSRWGSAYDAMDQAYCTQFVIRSGRALVFPIYKGTYHRPIDWGEEGPATQRDRFIIWSKEVRRTIDYLETRPDIDRAKIAFYGFSWGAALAPIILALDGRLKVGVLYVGGLYDEPFFPPGDPFNFCPRVKVPVLMVNGQLEIPFPLEESQKPLYESLGTPPDDKKHVIFPGGHGLIGLFGKEIREEILSWLDRYLGPVK